jgi:hypothetical protein
LQAQRLEFNILEPEFHKGRKENWIGKKYFKIMAKDLHLIKKSNHRLKKPLTSPDMINTKNSH